MIPSSPYQQTHAQAAEHLARAAHHGQWNEKANEPYIHHPERVRNYVQYAMVALRAAGKVEREGSSLDLLFDLHAIAWLHDTVEDTFVTSGTLTRVFPGPDLRGRIVHPVLLLTRPPSGGGDRYYADIAEDPRALVVKFADLMDNGDPVRLAKISDQATRIRLTEKYEHAADVMGVRKEFEAWKSHRSSLVPA